MTSAPQGSEEVREILEDLADTQSPDQVAEIYRSGERAEFLLDPETNELVAAVKIEPTFSPFAITPLGPGCATDSVCLRNSGGTNFGYIGTGTLSGTWNSIRYMAPGNRTTDFTYKNGSSTQSVNLVAWTSLTLADGKTVVTKLAR
ncbi:hypothetical protein [Cellulosimicrobium cellulans]|uniref:hypothetical protein n=1 Tax=Cellulosimicrobium cellulans TaxID=1710 RepID=UPI00240516A9|nr:hypothetical protein [Cellulosimicrobium cellulans]MDF9875624.1 hypothetical protein [Cellulosimicrobium cellulans]